MASRRFHESKILFDSCRAIGYHKNNSHNNYRISGSNQWGKIMAQWESMGDRAYPPAGIADDVFTQSWG
jgi:hypothetical protein